MPKNLKTSDEQIKESVCKFYLDNKDICDLNYSNARNANIGKIYENIEDINIIHSLFVQTSFVVITANMYEKNILHDNIYKLQNKKIKQISINLFPQRESKYETYAYCFEWQGYIVLHIEAQCTGSYTKGGSADIVRYVLNNQYIVPKGIVSLGICFGTHESDYHLGDVVISKKIYPYFIGSKIQESGYFVTDDNTFIVDSSLISKIKFIIEKNAFSELKSEVYFGNYITGEAVVNRKKARDEFVQQTKQPIIAGEMEGYGLFKECKGTYFTVPCLIVKSICDWAVMKNFNAKNIFEKICNETDKVSEEEQKSLKDRIQSYAAFQAFKVLDILICNKVFGESIFTDIITYIERFPGHAIYAEQIKNEIQNIIEKNMCNIHTTNKFVIMLIKELMHRELLRCDDPSELDGVLNKGVDEIGNWLLSIQKGGM